MFDGLIGLDDLLSNLLMMAGGFSFWLHGPLLKAAHIWQLAAPRVDDLVRKMSHQDSVVGTLISKVTCHQFCCILLVIQAKPSSEWEGTAQGCEHQQTGTIGVLSWTPFWRLVTTVDHVAADGLLHISCQNSCEL